MSDIVSRAQIKHVARLARLDLSSQELKKYKSQIAGILETFRELSEFSASVGVASKNTGALKNISREDKVESSLPLEQVLANAPLKKGKYFKVRGVFQ